VADVHIFTHTDLDGIASAAVYVRALRASGGKPAKVHFVESYKIHKALENALSEKRAPERVVLADLSLNAGNAELVAERVEELVRAGATVEWFDHHVWERSWVERLTSLGALVKVDQSTCAAGVVAKHLAETGALSLESGEHDCIFYIVDAVCSVDMWRWDHPLSPFIYRLLPANGSAPSDAWRRILVEELSECRMWSDDFDEVLEKAVSRELQGYERALSFAKVVEVGRGYKAAFVLRRPGFPPTSTLASYLASKTGSDFVIVARPDGGLSFRSKKLDVREIAVCLGGGGHRRASGARLKIPLLVKAAGYVVPQLKSWWVARETLKRVAQCLEKAEKSESTSGC